MVEGTNIGKELAGLRKEIYDARSLIIRTDNLLKTFHAELKSISDRQAQAERKHFVGHVAAYVVVGLMAGGGAVFYTHLQVQSVREAMASSVEEATSLAKKAELDRQKSDAELSLVEARARRALSLYHQLESEDAGARESGLLSLDKLKREEFDPFARSVLQKAEFQERRRVAKDAIAEAEANVRRTRYKQAKGALERFKLHADRLPPSWEPQLRASADYYLGTAEAKLGHPAAAVPLLDRYIKSAAPRSTRAHGSFVLGDALMTLGKFAKARAAWRAGLALSPGPRLLALLQARLAKKGTSSPVVGTDSSHPAPSKAAVSKLAPALTPSTPATAAAAPASP